LDFDAPMEKGKSYNMVLRFFDTQGNGEVLMSLADFKITPSTRTSPNTYTSESSLGPGIFTGSTGIEPVSMEIKQQGKTDLVKNRVLAKSGVVSFTVTTRNPGTEANYQFRLMDSKGQVAYKQAGKATVKGTKMKADLALKNQKPGTYQLWLSYTGVEGVQSLGLAMPVVVK
jgi:hypothetical protein